MKNKPSTKSIFLRKINFIAAGIIILISVSVSFAQEKSAGKVSRDTIITAAREIIATQKYCALITIDSTGKPDVRTMNPFQPEEDMSVWMATNSRSKKVQEIKNNQHVTLYYSDHTNAIGYVAINGRAVLVDDVAEKMKRKRGYWDQAFPDFKYLMLIKVIPEKIEVINYKHNLNNDPQTFEAPSVEFPVMIGN
jgi:general stress protein 26